jgi:O-antigen/teichoic acid export membrane protein
MKIELNGDLICNRFLDFEPMFFLAIAFFANIFVSSWATYLRCHKKEPFLAQSIVMGVLSCFSTVILGRLYGVYGVTIGFMILTVGLSVPWSIYIFVTKKRAWHGI